MERTESSSIFAEQMSRIRLITGKRTQGELAGFLGVCQSSVFDAARCGRIPAGWLVVLMRVKNIHPEWILTGNGPCFIGSAPAEEGSYAVADEAAACLADEEALRRLPSRMLADELIRRIAVAQDNAFCLREWGEQYLP